MGPPDGVSTARLVGSLACGLQQQGHDVTVVTTAPHYNRDLSAESRQPIHWSALRLIGTSHLEGVRIFHVAMPRKRGGVLLRLMAWLWFHAVSTAFVWFVLPKADVVVAPSPPLTIGVSAWLVCRARGASFVYNVQEIYPDVAIQLGAVRSRVLIGALRRLERFVYDRADAITVISAGMEANLRAKGVPAAKIQRIPNHLDFIALPAAAGPNSFSLTHGLAGRFVVTYAGNIGKPQGLEVVVGAAALLRHDDAILFVIVGDGSEKSTIERLIAQAGLGNILVLPYQPYSAIPEIYAASHVCLVLQAAGTGASVLPSKAVQIVGAGRPVLAVGDPDSDLASFVKATGAGLVVSPGAADQLAAGVTMMKNDYDGWCVRARAAQQQVVDAYSKEHVVRAYSALATSLSRRAGS